MITELFYSHFLTSTEIPFIQEVSGPYTSPILDTDELKMALRARKVSGSFDKRAPDPKRQLIIETFGTFNLQLYDFELSTL